MSAAAVPASRPGTLIAVIEDPERARRLARAICTDVQLYNSVQGLAPAEGARALAAPLREGLQLYVSRVSPGLRSLFDDAAREMCERVGVPFHPILEATAPSVPVASAMPMAAPHPEVPRRAPERPSSGVPPLLVALIAVACAIGGAAAFFVLSH